MLINSYIIVIIVMKRRMSKSAGSNSATTYKIGGGMVGGASLVDVPDCSQTKQPRRIIVPKEVDLMRRAGPYIIGTLS